MKLLLVKVLALTLVTTSKDALAQAQNQDENVVALRGSVFVQGDVFLTEDEDSTCREIGETCGPNHPACCDWINYCSSWHRTCCLGPGQTCSDDSECCTTSDWSGLCINGQCSI